MRALGYHKHVQLAGSPSDTGISFILLPGKGLVWSRVIREASLGHDPFQKDCISFLQFGTSFSILFGLVSLEMFGTHYTEA